MNEIRQQILAGERAERRSLLGTKRKKGADACAGLGSVEIQREAHRQASTRDSDRHRLPDHQVRVVHKRKSHDVQLVNLSGGGAMIAGALEPMLWDRVDLHLGEGGVIECAVRWLKGDRIGLEFAHETRLDCSEEASAKLLRAVIDQNFSDIEIEQPRRRKADRAAPQAPQAARDASEQRGGRRHPLIWSGSVHYDFETVSVRLRNISETGALIECATPLPVGAEPLLDLGDAGQVFAAVTWAVADQVGLKFKEPFDLARLARARPDVISADWERPTYTKPASPWSSPSADEWNRMSLTDLQEELEGFLKR